MYIYIILNATLKLLGIDYWLDNLMCNVPEVVMCYHQDGIVQKYELVKTEDLPQMKGSEFSPQLVTDIAHNILSFLKSKATKEGHTYWLFKGMNVDSFFFSCFYYLQRLIYFVLLSFRILNLKKFCFLIPRIFCSALFSSRFS